MGRVQTVDVDTPHGPARAHLDPVAAAHGAVVLGHGAGGGVGAPDLVAAAAGAREAGFAVALVEQPYRVAGRRSPAPAHHLDAAWIAVCARSRGRAARAAARHGRALVRRARRVPDGVRDRRRGCPLPRVSARAAAARGHAAAEPARGARRGDGADPRRAGRARPVRDAPAGEVARRRPGRRRPQPPQRPWGARRGRSGLARRTAVASVRRVSHDQRQLPARGRAGCG